MIYVSARALISRPDEKARAGEQVSRLLAAGDFILARLAASVLERHKSPIVRVGRLSVAS